jgi:hypothetical protein
MSTLELKILKLERLAAESEAAYRVLRRTASGLDGERAARLGATLANLLRDAADARYKALDLRARLPSQHPLHGAPPRTAPPRSGVAARASAGGDERAVWRSPDAGGP